MTALVRAFGLKPISAYAEVIIGRLMKRRAVKEGHRPRLPGPKGSWQGKL